jgi:hypothetical protein
MNALVGSGRKLNLHNLRDIPKGSKCRGLLADIIAVHGSNIVWEFDDQGYEIGHYSYYCDGVSDELKWTYWPAEWIGG